MASRPKRKSNIPLSIVRPSSRTKHLRIEQVQVPLPVHSELVSSIATDTVGESSSIGPGDYSADIGDDTMSSETPHTRRKQKAAEKWEELRSALTRTVIENECLPPGVPCYICGNEDIAVRCVECGPFNYYCESCAIKLHENCYYHHCPEIWKVYIHDQASWYEC